jgi:hypothetical protein
MVPLRLSHWLTQRIGAQNYVTMRVTFYFWAEGVGLRGKLVAGDGEGSVQSGQVGDDDCVGVVCCLVGDGEGAAQHGGEAALEFAGGCLVDWVVAGDDDLAGKGSITRGGGVG